MKVIEINVSLCSSAEMLARSCQGPSTHAPPGRLRRRTPLAVWDYCGTVGRPRATGGVQEAAPGRIECESRGPHKCRGPHLAGGPAEGPHSQTPHTGHSRALLSKSETKCSRIPVSMPSHEAIQGRSAHRHDDGRVTCRCRRGASLGCVAGTARVRGCHPRWVRCGGRVALGVNEGACSRHGVRWSVLKLLLHLHCARAAAHFRRKRTTVCGAGAREDPRHRPARVGVA